MLRVHTGEVKFFSESLGRVVSDCNNKKGNKKHKKQLLLHFNIIFVSQFSLIVFHLVQSVPQVLKAN